MSAAPGARPVVTPADTARARHLVAEVLGWRGPVRLTPADLLELRGLIAAAFADARAEGELAELEALRAKVSAVETLADKLAHWSEINRQLMGSPEMPPEGRTYHDGLGEAQRLAADRIRRALDGPSVTPPRPAGDGEHASPPPIRHSDETPPLRR